MGPLKSKNFNYFIKIGKIFSVRYYIRKVKHDQTWGCHVGRLLFKWAFKVLDF